MQINLRFGMHRDIQAIHDSAELIDGLVIPAHILAYQAASTSVFVSSLPSKGYVIDPMTYLFQASKANHVNDAGELRPSVQKMCAAFQASLVERLDALSPDQSLLPHDFPAVGDLCAGVLDFQRTVIQNESSTSKANRYLERYSQSRATAPRFLVAPYFYFSMPNDQWYQLSLQCARTCREMSNSDEAVAGVICTQLGCLNEASIAQIVADYSEFDAVFVWVDDYDESRVSATHITQVRSLVTRLAENTIVESLYGGYLVVLGHFDGMSALSHGILYTQSKSTQQTPGGGGVPERYYIPAFHQFRSLSQTDLILHQHPELICNCPICSTHLNGDPDNIIFFSDEPSLLREHFLHVRRVEVDSIASNSPENAAGELLSTYNQYHEAVSSLPNPDAVLSGGAMQGLASLREWAIAYG